MFSPYHLVFIISLFIDVKIPFSMHVLFSWTDGCILCAMGGFAMKWKSSCPLQYLTTLGTKTNSLFQSQVGCKIINFLKLSKIWVLETASRVNHNITSSTLKLRRYEVGISIFVVTTTCYNSMGGRNSENHQFLW